MPQHLQCALILELTLCILSQNTRPRKSFPTFYRDHIHNVPVTLSINVHFTRMLLWFENSLLSRPFQTQTTPLSSCIVVKMILVAISQCAQIFKAFMCRGPPVVFTFVFICIPPVFTTPDPCHQIFSFAALGTGKGWSPFTPCPVYQGWVYRGYT